MKVVNYKIIKRALDIMVSFILLVICILPMLLIAIIIKIDSPGPIIFKQKRYGKNKKVFEIYKFRTMKATSPKNVATIDFKHYDFFVTGFGAFLRRFGIDEIPQLFNILKGEMSFIGPRPVIVSEKKLVKERDKYNVYSVLPGISGWAQVNGRDEMGIKAKAKLDGEYVKKFGLKMDVLCVLKTFGILATGHGYQEGGATDNSEIIKATQK